MRKEVYIVMKLEFLDKEILRLTALLKDYPIGSFFHENTADLADCGYLRRARNGLTYRLTDKGYKTANEKGMIYQKDKYPLSRGKLLNRRIECSKAILTMYRAGINVFNGQGNFRFFPAFALRRMKDLTLGASQLIGLLIAESITYLVYYAGKELKVNMELEAAKRILPLAGAPSSLSVILMCESYKDVFNSNLPAFPLDIFAVTCNDTGAKQLKLMLVKDGRTKLVNKTMNYKEHDKTNAFCDGVKDEVPCLYAYDMNIKRIFDFCNYADANRTISHLITMEEQAGFFNQNMDFVKIRYYKDDVLFHTFEITPELYPYGGLYDA